MVHFIISLKGQLGLDPTGWQNAPDELQNFTKRFKIKLGSKKLPNLESGPFMKKLSLLTEFYNWVFS